jgi:hypothetical protein
MVGATVGISRLTAICPTLPNMPQPADFDGFLYNPAQFSQHDVPMVTQTLRELPTLTNGLEAELKQNPPDLEDRFLHRWMRYCMDRSFVMGNF